MKKIGILLGVLTFPLFVAGFMIFQSYRFAQTLPSPTSCFVTSMNQVHLCSKDSTYLSYQQIPEMFFRTLIISEDTSFFFHQGLDWDEIKDSFKRNWEEGRFARGGSTLTQQLAKNLYLTREKTINRKMREYFIAKNLEGTLKKTKILELYANVVQFGPKVFGLKQAASLYFQKSVSELNLLEMVYLVSLLPSPTKLSQSHQTQTLSESNQWRMMIILKRLYRTKRIDDRTFVYAQMLIEDNPWPFPDFFVIPIDESIDGDVIEELDQELENFSEQTESEEEENFSAEDPEMTQEEAMTPSAGDSDQPSHDQNETEIDPTTPREEEVDESDQ